MKKVPYPLCMLKGAIGKKIVVKQYRHGTLVTKYPDMKKIIASEGQRNCRNLFKEAVKYARSINNNPAKKSAYLLRIAKGKSVYNTAVKEYMLRAKKKF